MKPARALAAALAVSLATPLAADQKKPAVARPPFEYKLARLLQLEDERRLRFPPPVPPPAPPKKKKTLPPPPIPGVFDFLKDPEARVRRRAALAAGRIGDRAAAPALLPLLRDPEPEVRQMAAFALGLLGDRSASNPLLSALKDPSALVAGRAAEALGRIGEARAARPIADMILQYLGAPEVTALAPDDLRQPLPAQADAVRLGLYALVRLKDAEALRAAILSGDQPRLRWWPLAYAIGRIEDRGMVPALITFARAEGAIGRAFAARGLGALRDPAAVETLLPLLDDRSPEVVVTAVRALAQIGDARAVPALLRMLGREGLDEARLAEVVTALGDLRAAAAFAPLQDFADRESATLRALTLRALAKIDPESFLIVLSSLDPDKAWSVRAALATALGDIGGDAATSGVSAPPGASAPDSTAAAGSAIPVSARLTGMLKDRDQRVVPSVLRALTKIRLPGVGKLLIEHLRYDDPVVRVAAAEGLGTLQAAGSAEAAAGDAALAAAYQAAERDNTYLARAAILDALAKYGAAQAVPIARRALEDKDWAMRVHAAEVLRALTKEDASGKIRPAPTGRDAAFYEQPALVAVPFTPHAYVETARGSFEIELTVIDAPLTSANFMALARRGFFDGLQIHRVVPNFVIQDGDPRGDGEGGPGYTIRDEVNEESYLRGTVGMALDWQDTGGSQWFVTHSPQPHLDGRYTVFGRVVRGLEVVDALRQWDAIKKITIWDGLSASRD